MGGRNAMMNNEITNEWIAQQRAVCEAANASLYSEDAEAAKREIVCTAFDAALDALEAAYAENATLREQNATLTAERDAAVNTINRIDYQLEKQQVCASMGNRQYAHGIRDARKIIAQMLPVCAENAQEGSGRNG